MKRLLIYPALFAFLFSAACSDDDPIDPPPADKDPKTTKAYLTEKWEDMLQDFTVDMSEAPVEIKTKGGIVITIPDGSFTVGGEIVEGEVNIQIREMLTMSSIVFSGTNTNYNGGAYTNGEPRYFETDGFFHISAAAGGKKVDDNLSNWLTVTAPKVFNPDREFTMVWPGTETAGENGDQFAWFDGDKEDDNGRVGEAWTNIDGDFEFNLGKLGWCNCDMFWDGDRTTVKVTLTGKFGKFASYFAADGDTYVFFCAKGSPVMAQLYNIVDESTVMSYENSMPKETQGRMFAFSIVDGVYTYAEKEITIEEDMSVTLDMKEVTKKYIDGKIAELDNFK